MQQLNDRKGETLLPQLVHRPPSVIMTIEVMNKLKGLTHFRRSACIHRLRELPPNLAISNSTRSKDKKRIRRSASMPLDLKYRDYDFSNPCDPGSADQRVPEHVVSGRSAEASRATLAPPVDHTARREGSASSLRTIDLPEWVIRPMDSEESLRQVLRVARKLPAVPVCHLPDNFVVPADFPTEDQVIRANMTDEQLRIMDTVAAIRAGRQAGIVQGGATYTGRQPVHSRTVSTGQSYSRPTHIAYPEVNLTRGPTSIPGQTSQVSALQRSASARTPARSEPVVQGPPRSSSKARHEDAGPHRSDSGRKTGGQTLLRRRPAKEELRPGHKPNALSDSTVPSSVERWGQLPPRPDTAPNRPVRDLRRAL